jgi:hypothetical protein
MCRAISGPSAVKTSARRSKDCSVSRSTCATRASVRDSPGEAARAADATPNQALQIRLGDVAAIRINDGPPMLKSENARLSGWVYVDVRGTRPARRSGDAASRREGGAAAARVLASWSGQFEYLERATAKLKLVVPATLLIIFVLLYLTFGRFDEAAADHGHPAVRPGGRRVASLAARLTTCRSPAASASSRWPGFPPSSASSCCCT